MSAPRRFLFVLAPGMLAGLLAVGCGGSTPKASPDLIFVTTRDGDYSIYGSDLDGSHQRRLTKEKGDASTPQGLFFQIEPAWSPDGSQIAFVSRRDGPAHLYVMRADGTDTRRLTNTGRDDHHPSWSPDGRRIVFARDGMLEVMPAGGGEARRIGDAPGNAQEPAWSPDGKLIAYDYRNPGTPIREIYVVRPDGTGVRRLTSLGNVSAAPAWSRDGRRIAFESNARGGHDEIYTVRLDGKGVRRITHSENSDTIEPAWAPDGAVTFSREGALWSIDAAGKETQLTDSKNNDSSSAYRPTGPT
jgi:Tol biopolymer transport system component